MNYIEPTKDLAVIQKARDEMMMVAAKYDLTGCFYITQADNLASTEWFFQENIAAKPNQMPNIMSDLSATVPACARLLMKALLRFSATSNMFARPGKERAAMQEEEAGWARTLDSFTDGLHAKIVMGATGSIDGIEPPRTEAELRKLHAEGKIDTVETGHTDSIIHNRIRQIRNAVVGDYFNADHLEAGPGMQVIRPGESTIDLPTNTSISDMLGDDIPPTTTD